MGLEVIQLILTIASAAHQQAQYRKQQAEMDKRKGIKFTQEGTAAPLPVVYGKQSLGGIITSNKVSGNYNTGSETNATVFAKNFNNSSVTGTKNEFLFQQAAICYEGIEGVQHVLVNDIDYRGSTKEMKENESEFSHRIKTFNNGGSADAVASNNGFDPNNTFTKAAFASNVFRLNRDKPQYRGSPNVTYLLKGRKIRKITASSNTYTLNTNYEYSNNPAYCLLDYLLNNDFGRGLSTSQVDLESFWKAASVCDSTVLASASLGGQVNGVDPVFSYLNYDAFPATLDTSQSDFLFQAEQATNDDAAGLYRVSSINSQGVPVYTATTSPSSQNLKLYECNMTIDTTASLRDNIYRFLDCMGQCDFVWTPEGKYKLLLDYPQSENDIESLIFTSDVNYQSNLSYVLPAQSSTFANNSGQSGSLDYGGLYPFKSGSVWYTRMQNGDDWDELTKLNIDYEDANNVSQETLIRGISVGDKLSCYINSSNYGVYEVTSVSPTSTTSGGHGTSRVEVSYITSQGNFSLSTGNSFYLRLGVSISDHKFTEDDILRESVSIKWPTAAERFNHASVSFENEFENFKKDTISWPPLTDAVYNGVNGYLAEDNNIPLHTNLSPEGITNPFHAQAYAEEKVRKSRSIFTISFTANRKGLTVEPGDVISITSSSIGFDTPEYIKVESVRINSSLSVEIKGYRYDHTTLAWNVPNHIAYSVRRDVEYEVPPPTTLTYNSSGDLLGTSSGKISWVAPTDYNNPEYLVEISSNNGTTYSTLGTTRHTSFDINGLQTGVYKFSVQTKTRLGDLSERVEVSQTIQLTTVGQIKAVYADDSSGTNKTTTWNNHEYVLYWEYNSTFDLTQVTGTWAKFVGNDGAAGSQGPPSVSQTHVYDHLKTSSANLAANGEWKISTDTNPSSSASGESSWSTSIKTIMLYTNDKNGTFHSNSISELQDGDFVTFTSTQSGKTGKAIFEVSSVSTVSFGSVSQYHIFGETKSVTGTLTNLTENSSVNVNFGFSRAGAGAAGAAGERGAGWWRYETNSSASVAGLDSTSTGQATLDTYFNSATGLSKVAGDRLIIVNTSDEAGAYLRNNANTSWTAQNAFIDGNLLVSGTITSDSISANGIDGDKIAANSIKGSRIEAGQITADKLNIDGELSLGNNAGFIAGRTFNSEYDEAGLFIGRETRSNNSQGFELSTSSVNSNNELTGIIHNEQDHLKLFNPTLVIGGDLSGGAGGTDTYDQSQTINLGVNQGRTITVTALGGGGGGGGGHANYGSNSGGTGDQGGTTSVAIYHTSTASSNLIQTINGIGGAGGQSGGGGSGAHGSDGQSTTFGAGGSGGGENTAGSDAPSGSYGAAGGGGGGDDEFFFEPAGYAGLGGTAAVATVENISITQSTDIYAVITIGAGGAGDSSSVDYAGGDGHAGAASISSILSGTRSITSPQIISRNSLFGLLNFSDIAYSTSSSPLYNATSYDRLVIAKNGWTPVDNNGYTHTNGDHWFKSNTSNPRRLISQIGSPGTYSNSHNNYNWNERDVLVTSTSDLYRSQNSSTMNGLGVIFLEAGLEMKTDRGATWREAILIRGDEWEFDLEQYAREIIAGMS